MAAVPQLGARLGLTGRHHKGTMGKFCLGCLLNVSCKMLIYGIHVFSVFDFVFADSPDKPMLKNMKLCSKAGSKLTMFNLKQNQKCHDCFCQNFRFH